MTSQVDKPNRDGNLLAPWFEDKLNEAIAECNELGYPIRMFEGYRSPARQDWLYGQGRSRPGKKVTYARGWESFHQFGVAADLAFYIDKKWTWEGPWEKVLDVFERHGFESLDFEKSHVQITCGMTTAEAYRMAKEQGILAVWFVIERRLKHS